MNHQQNIAFQELRESARELRARANADPLHQAAGLLEAAIVQLGRCDDLADQAKDLEQKRDKLKNQVETLEEHNGALLAERKALEGEIATLKARIDRLHSIGQDKLIEQMADNQLKV